MNSERIQLKNPLPGTAEWIYFDPEGNFVAEYYDHSEGAHNIFGRDIAYLVKVRPSHLGKLLRHLQGKNIAKPDGKEMLLDFLKRLQGKSVAKPDRQEIILHLVEEKFASYFQIKKWLEQERIPFLKIIDDWA